MSSIYKSLAEEDIRKEKESLNLLETQLQPKGLGKGFKTVIIGGFILALASVVGSGYLYKVINKEKRHREALEASQMQIREKAGEMEQDSAKSKAEINKLRQQLQTYTTQRADFEKKLDDSRKEVAALRTKLKEIEEKTEAIHQAADKIQTEMELQPLGPELPGATALAAKTPASASKTGTPAPAIAASKAPAAAPVKVFNVLTVNRKFNFIVVNLGLKDNLKIGDALQIQRDGKNIARATVEKIYDNFAAATITDENKKTPIKEGDKISKA